jgi:hypothetical protein
MAMAIELYRRGGRVPATRNHTPRLPRRKYRFGAHKKRLRDPSTRMYEAMLVFGKAVGAFVGTNQPRQTVAKSGIDAVFHWWCKDGPRGTGHDKREDGAIVAAQTAENFGFDEALVESLMPALMERWLIQRCRNGCPHRKKPYFDRQTDPVLVNKPLAASEYRFAGG